MTIIYKEKNSIEKVREILCIENPSSILLITGNKSYKVSGAKNKIEKQISDYNVTHLSGFGMYPPIENVQEAIDIIQKEKIDFIIAIGGGTVMDVGKTASVFYKERENIKEHILKEQKPDYKNIKKLIIPTTAGTGAEITPFSSIYINKKKYSINNNNMIPDYIILAPELTYNLDKKITAQTGYDALAQAIEGFWSAKATKESKEYSKEAIHLILPNLKNVVNHPTKKNRELMMMGAHLAGKAIAIAKTTTAHALSHPLMTHKNIPHGHAVSLFLPYFFPINEKAREENIHKDLNLKYVKDTFNELLLILGVSDGMKAKSMLFKLTDDINLERDLGFFNIRKKELEVIIKEGFSNPKAENNPVKVGSKEIINIFKDQLQI
jgi:alcohol dehydrogenase class IV